MAYVGRVQLKRRFSELPPDTLILEPSSKHPAKRLHYIRHNTSGRRGSEDARSQSQNTIQQQSQPQQQQTTRTSPRKPTIERKRRLFHLNHVPAPTSGQKRGRSDDDHLAVFEEKRPKSARSSISNIPNGLLHASNDTPTASTQAFKRPGRGAATLKRPSPQQQQPSQQSPPSHQQADQQHINELAAYMHEAALEEVQREEAAASQQSHHHQRQQQQKSTPSASSSAAATPTPKITGDRSRALHRQRAQTNGSISSQHHYRNRTNSVSMSIADDSEYVYDTYILAPAVATPSSGNLNGEQYSSSSSAVVGGPTEHGFTSHPQHPHAPHHHQHDQLPLPLGELSDNVGYLVISSEDESIWETYMEEEGLSDGDGRSDGRDEDDDEDENAEDFYAADYPEDELDEDDGFGKGAYGYRGRRGSDEEEEDAGAWVGGDEDRVGWSDDDEDGDGGDGRERRAYEEMMNPFGRGAGAGRWARYLRQGGERGAGGGGG